MLEFSTTETLWSCPLHHYHSKMTREEYKWQVPTVCLQYLSFSQDKDITCHCNYIENGAGGRGGIRIICEVTEIEHMYKHISVKICILHCKYSMSILALTLQWSESFGKCGHSSVWYIIKNRKHITLNCTQHFCIFFH